MEDGTNQERSRRGLKAVKPGIYDRCFYKDGTRTGVPETVDGRPNQKRYRAHFHKSKKKTGEHWQHAESFPTVKEAQDWRDEKALEWRKRDSLEYQREKQLSFLRGMKVRDMVFPFLTKGTTARGTSLGYKVKSLDERFSELSEHDTSEWISMTWELHKFCLNSPLADMDALKITTVDAQKEFDRLIEEGTYLRNGTEKPMSLGTVRRLRSDLQTAWNWTATSTNDYLPLKERNPFKGLKLPTPSSYERSVREGEFELLEIHCRKLLGTNKFYLPLAIHLAAQTGMRAQEVFGLSWKDIDLVKRRIFIKKAKANYKQTDKGDNERYIVLPFHSKLILRALRHYLIHKGEFKETDMLFPKTQKGEDPKLAMLDAFEKTVKRAGIQPYMGKKLTFRCLRRAAKISFDWAGLTPDQRDFITGHNNKGISSIYDDDLKDHILTPIQEHLDRYQIGCTEAEGIAQGRLISDAQFAKARSLMAKRGSIENDYPWISFSHLDAFISGKRRPEKVEEDWAPNIPSIKEAQKKYRRRLVIKKVASMRPGKSMDIWNEYTARETAIVNHAVDLTFRRRKATTKDLKYRTWITAEGEVQELRSDGYYWKVMDLEYIANRYDDEPSVLKYYGINKSKRQTS